ncbi:MAG TPA: MBL fold metallo-hydrolase [Gemmatimonadota bacterium]|nr:MBL fold metallo-hydrolase [Gemmatimonadota bacterium]
MPFAAYHAPFLLDRPGGKEKKQHLLWGDAVELLGSSVGSWVKVHSRKTDGWIRQEDLQDEPLLEVNYVDIGQGDGCHIVTPDGRNLLIDAGEKAEMYRYFNWRYDLEENPERRIRFAVTVISHPDLDHYGGLLTLNKKRFFAFGSVYHNGIVERVGKPGVGPKRKFGNRSYLTDVIPDRVSLSRIIDDPEKVGRRNYPILMRDLVREGLADDVRMVSSLDRFLPGFGEDEELAIEVLGPIPEPTPTLPHRLRWFGSEGKTKNGHSVVLKLRYRDITLLLGGDLNIPSEKFLLGIYTGLDPAPRSETGARAVIEAARPTFEVDVAKACHHGSGDFTTLFIQAVNPRATVVSSGDDESHAHPRPDTLGAFGKYARGERPLIFSTELARSTREVVEDPDALRAEISRLLEIRDQLTDPQARQKIRDRIQAALDRIERSIAVYGTIYLRTDGRKLMIAQKLERQRPTTKEKWDVHRFEPDAQGELIYQSKH